MDSCFFCHDLLPSEHSVLEIETTDEKRERFDVCPACADHFFALWDSLPDGPHTIPDLFDNMIRANVTSFIEQEMQRGPRRRARHVVYPLAILEGDGFYFSCGHHSPADFLAAIRRCAPAESVMLEPTRVQHMYWCQTANPDGEPPLADDEACYSRVSKRTRGAFPVTVIETT
jgi:hypothetical protein